MVLPGWFWPDEASPLAAVLQVVFLFPLPGAGYLPVALPEGTQISDLRPLSDQYIQAEGKHDQKIVEVDQ